MGFPSLEDYRHIARGTGAKKFVSATAVADYGDAQAWAVRTSAQSRLRFALGHILLLNRSGSAAVVGVGVRYPIAAWTAGQVTSAGVFTDDTADAQSATTADFPLHDRTNSGSGFLISSTDRFNCLGLVQSAAGDQTTPTKIVELWDGTSWVDLVATLFVSDTLIGGGTGEKLLWWPLPPDGSWVTGGSGTGVPSGSYNARVRHTTVAAGTADPVASQVFVGFGELVSFSLANNTSTLMDRAQQLVLPAVGDAIFPVFSVASANNYGAVDVRLGL